MSKPEAGHTPFPEVLKWDADNESILCGHEAVAFVPHSWREYGPLIVEAVNSHAALMEAARALKKIIEFEDKSSAELRSARIDLPEIPWISDARSALAELEKAGIKL